MLANVGGKDDLKAAIQDFRAGVAKRVKKHERKKNGLANTTSAPSTPKKAEFTVVDEAMTACADKTRLALVERHVNRLGIPARCLIGIDRRTWVHPRADRRYSRRC